MFGSEDMATWFNLLRVGRIAYGMNEVLADYRIGISSLSSNKWISSKRLWKLYRTQENLGFLKALYYHTLHNINAIKKRM